MTKNLLVELGLEEMPAYVVKPSMKQLRQKMGEFLEANRLSFEKIEMFSTPRRLAVRVVDLADRQSDYSQDFKGPAKKIALDVEGHFTKAAEGFAKGKGLTVADIEFRDVKGEEYAYVTKHEAGQPAQDILSGLIDVLKSLTFPVNMHWGKHSFEYIRPVHTLLVLLDDQALDLNFLDIKSGRISRGHRFLGKETKISSADSYEAELEAEFVLANAAERENRIIEQIQTIEKTYNVSVEIDEDLLNEVLNLVEYPTAFMGSFAEKYLDLPEEVLVTSMKTHQRYFVVRDQNGKLLPNFVSVRNGNEAFIENVIKGNEKVLLARLEDGEFFWHEDQKLQISDLVEKLKAVTFHEKIGSLYEHMMRTKAIAAYLADLSDLTEQEKRQVERAANIYKFDLLTGMVGEFDELQGIMGEKYATLAGEDQAVAIAIREHYLPTSSEGELPDSKVGAILAVADKFDILLSFFTVGLIPSGSNDPYALRRATQGIVRILDKFGWEIPLDKLVESLYQLDFTSLTYQHRAEVMAFIRGRVEKMFDQSVPKDIREAVLDSSTHIVRLEVEAAKTLTEKTEDANFKTSVESLSRVFNLADQLELDNRVDPSLFENDYEQELYDAIIELHFSEEMAENVDRLFALSPLIDAFFDKTMVMVEDQAVKNNRLALLATLVRKAKTIAAFNEINTK